jgi:hypothetical protein
MERNDWDPLRTGNLGRHLQYEVTENWGNAGVGK